MASTKLICVSDTHLACHDLLTPKLIDWYEADNDLIFIHTGDGCNSGSGRDVDKLFRWLESLPFKTKIYVPGNHDISLDLNCTNIWWNRNNWKDNIKYTKDMLKEIAPSVTLLLNDVITLDGIIFGGVSRIPDLQQWAFYSTEEDNERFFQLLPKVDVLISHSPFQGFEATRYEFSGSRSMYEYLVNNNVNYFIHGHIHEGYGYRNIDRINCYNVAILNEHYSGCNEPTIIELIEKEIIL